MFDAFSLPKSFLKSMPCLFHFWCIFWARPRPGQREGKIEPKTVLRPNADPTKSRPKKIQTGTNADQGKSRQGEPASGQMRSVCQNTTRFLTSGVTMQMQTIGNNLLRNRIAKLKRNPKFRTH